MAVVLLAARRTANHGQCSTNRHGTHRADRSELHAFAGRFRPGSDSDAIRQRTQVGDRTNFPDSNGRALLLLPLPNVGTAEIEVVAVPRDTSLWCGLKDYRPYLTGRPMPNAGLHSNKIDVDVRRRDIPQRPEHPTAFVSQWEPWFAPGSMWTTAQAVPLVGFLRLYRSRRDPSAPAVADGFGRRRRVVRLVEPYLGLQALGRTRRRSERHRAQHRTGARSDGRHARRGSSRSAGDHHAGPEQRPPATMEALNEELNWIYQYMVRNPRFKGLWYEYDGKPLTVILDTGAMGVKEGKTETAFRVPFFKQTLGWTAEQIDDLRRRNPPVDSSRFTIRWMSSQNQLTGHDKLGYWSWMDGSLKPTVTYKGTWPNARRSIRPVSPKTAGRRPKHGAAGTDGHTSNRSKPPSNTVRAW